MKSKASQTSIVTVNTKDLKAALQAAIKITGTKATDREATRNVKRVSFSTGLDKLIVSGTDEQQTLSLPVPFVSNIKWKAFFKLSISQADAKALLSLMPPHVLAKSETIEISHAKDTDTRFSKGTDILYAKIGDIQFQYPAIERDPNWPEGEGDSYEIDAKALHAILSEVSYTASQEKTRLLLTGIHLKTHTKENKIEAVATDTHRLHIASVEAHAGYDTQTTIPAESWKALLPILAKAEGIVKITSLPDYTMLQNPAFTLWYKHANLSQYQQYPNYEKVLPNPETIKSSIALDAKQREAFEITVKEAVALHKYAKADTCNKIELSVAKAGNILYAKVAPQDGKHNGLSHSIPCDAKLLNDSKEYPIVYLDAALLQTLLKNMPGEGVKIELIAPLSPITLTPIHTPKKDVKTGDKSGKKVLQLKVHSKAVIMPVRGGDY